MTYPTTAAERAIARLEAAKRIRAAEDAAFATARQQRAAARAEELTPRQERAIAHALPVPPSPFEPDPAMVDLVHAAADATFGAHPTA